MKQNVVLARAMFLTPLTIAACTLSLLRVPALPTAEQVSSTPSPTVATSPEVTSANGSPTSVSGALPTTSAAATSSFCDDDRPRTVLAQFKSAILESDGALLASLVSPAHGMEVRLFRDGRVVNYDGEHAAALFESTYAVNWGLAPASGLPTTGSFHELVIPDLLDVLGKDYVASCNQIRTGGTTYTASWPYAGIDFYSLYWPGSQTYDGMDWHTWLIGMHYVQNKPYLYALMQFKWEP